MWLAGGLAILFAAYVLGGFFVVPRVVRSQAVQWVKTDLDKDLALGDIRFNPFTLALDVDDIAVPGADGATLVSLGHFRVSVSLLSLFQSAYRFNEVRLDRPYIHAVIRPDGTLNLIELKSRTPSEGPTPSLIVDALTVDQGRVVYADQSQPDKPQETISPISFVLNDFHTKSDEGGAFTLNATSERGEHFAWSGDLSIAPIASKGRFTVTALQSATVQRFLGARLPVVLTGGQIGFQADYDFAYDPSGLRANVSLPSLTLAGFAFDGKPQLFNGHIKLDQLTASTGPIAASAPTGRALALSGTMTRFAVRGLNIAPAQSAPDENIAVGNLTLENAHFDYAARQAEIGNLALDDANIYVRRERGGKLSLMAMLPPKPAVTAAPATPGTPWKFALKTFALNNATLRLSDRAVSPQTNVTVSALNVSATGAGSDLTQPVTVHIDAAIDDGAHFTGDGAIVPSTNTGDLKFVLADLPLRPFMGYAPRMPGLALRSGEASASGDVHFEGADTAKLTFRGDASIDRFNLYEVTTKSPLFAWRAFSLNSIDYAKNRVTIGRARLVHPVGQVAVLPSRQFNFTSLTGAKSANTAVPIQSRRPAKSNLSFKLKRLDITGGTMGFADYSIDPNFRARIEAMNGYVSNITNAPGQAATIDLSGHVIDRYSPATIKGRMDLLGYDQLTDMQLVFRNIDLPVFNPYSGRYAGYAIAKGKLTTELAYKIDHRQLKAEQHIVIDQLEWGEATNSKDRVPLPVRLATALLKDKDGVIDLNLPLSGSLDDPKFSVWPIVWQIVGNIIEKAVTAPFQLIGAIFAGADKAQFIDFAPGQSTLPAGSSDALGALAKAMADRPVLKLDIPAGPGNTDDANAIADAKIDAILMAKEIKRGENADVATLDADELHDRLEDLYRDKLGKRPDFPEYTDDQLKSAPAKPDASDSDRRTILESQWMRDQLRTAFHPTATELTELGSTRATAVRDALLAGGTIDPARVFLTTATGAASAEGHSRLSLKFE